MRSLIYLLVLLNLGYLVWTLTHPDGLGPGTRLAPPVKLLNEPAVSPGAPQTGESGPATEPPTTTPSEQAPSGPQCVSLGPLPSLVAVERIAQELTLRGLRHTRRKETERMAEAYNVFIPPLPNRGAALELSRKLTEQGVSDYYIVSVEEKRNAISLGLFEDPATAAQRVNEIRKLGHPAESEVRYGDRTVYWLDFDPEESAKLADQSLQMFLGQTEVPIMLNACLATAVPASAPDAKDASKN